MIKVLIDTETTGLSPKRHHIWQLAGYVLDDEDNVLEKFNWKFRPLSLDGFDDSTTEMTGVSRDDLLKIELSARSVYEQFIKMLAKYCDKYNKKDKMQLIGWNLKFDSEFLREFFTKNGDNYFGSWFWNPGICLMFAASYFMMRARPAFPDFKLGTICKCAQIDWNDDEAHDAFYDVQKTYEFFLYLKNNGM